MTCHHEGQELVWEATVEVPDLEEFSYKYAVVTSERKAVRLEQSSRLLQLPASLTAQSLIELQDAWQVRHNLCCLNFITCITLQQGLYGI